MAREKRLLIADDDDAIRTLLFTVLRRRGFKVDTARNGQEAVECMARCVYAVILLDLMMPVMNGYEVLDQLLARPQSDRPLVVVLTAGAEPRGLDPGIVSGTIRKPFDVTLLVDTVTACINTWDERMQPDGCPSPESDEPRDDAN